MDIILDRRGIDDEASGMNGDRMFNSLSFEKAHLFPKRPRGIWDEIDGFRDSETCHLESVPEYMTNFVVDFGSAEGYKDKMKNALNFMQLLHAVDATIPLPNGFHRLWDSGNHKSQHRFHCGPRIRRDLSLQEVIDKNEWAYQAVVGEETDTFSCLLYTGCKLHVTEGEGRILHFKAAMQVTRQVEVLISTVDSDFVFDDRDKRVRTLESRIEQLESQIRQLQVDPSTDSGNRGKKR